MSNQRFSDYATSGAFALSLSRNQVSALAMIADNPCGGFGMSGSSLERKGLVEPVAKPDDFGGKFDNFEYRASYAGLLCAGLLREAGLTNGPPDPVAAELASLRAEIEKLRLEAAKSRRDAWSAMARMDEAERELAAAQSEIKSLREELRSGLRLKDAFRHPVNEQPLVRKRDPTPERSNDQLRADIQEHA